MSAPAAGIGHNRGPAMDEGVAWRRHCWTVARAELLPHLPLEVIRLRVRRAKALGLDYRTYAVARETSGRDIIAFLYSSNALRILAPGDALPEERALRLGAVEDCAHALLAHAPLVPAALAAALEAGTGIAVAGAASAPTVWASWRELRARVLAALAPAGIAPAGVMLIGDAPGERDWREAARLGSYLAADRYFPAAS
jgi:hypothetical protein